MKLESHPRADGKASEAGAKALASVFSVFSDRAMGLFDTHTHLESFARRGDLAATLDRARAAGIEAMITIGTSAGDWSLYRDLATQYPGYVHYSAGLHPCSVGESWAEEIDALSSFWSGEVKPVALGEIGLDRFHLPKDLADAEKIFGWQRAAFEEGLRMAKQFDAPIVIHSRGAFHECVEMIDASGVEWNRVVFHCFTEGASEMNELLRRGGRGSFTGILTYKNAEAVREAARAQGLDWLMIETDAPYLTPMPHRGKPNEPGFLRDTAEFAATVFGVSSEELSRITARNAREFFGL